MYAPLFPLLVAFNGYTHYRLVTNRTITWPWILGLTAMDLTMVSVATVIGGGFSHYFLAPAVLPPAGRVRVGFHVFQADHGLCDHRVRPLSGDKPHSGGWNRHGGKGREAPAGPDLRHVCGGGNGQPDLQASSGAGGGLRWSGSVSLQRERIELSQAIHDTAAQTAFMIGLGIDAAKQVAGDSNEELAARLDATSRLSKTVVWQLRHPIDMGRIFEGSELGWTLDSHVATFRTITSVSAELTQNGVEPPLSD